MLSEGVDCEPLKSLISILVESPESIRYMLFDLGLESDPEAKLLGVELIDYITELSDGRAVDSDYYNELEEQSRLIPDKGVGAMLRKQIEINKGG